MLAELDYLLSTRAGLAARRRFLADVERSAYLLESIDTADLASAHRTINRHYDLAVSVADASIVVLAERHGIRDVLTLDERPAAT